MIKPVNPSSQLPTTTRTSLTQARPGRYTFYHKGVPYRVSVNPATETLTPEQHQRLKTILRALVSQMETDGVKHCAFSKKGHIADGKPYKPGQPKRVAHYLLMLQELFGLDVLLKAKRE